MSAAVFSRASNSRACAAAGSGTIQLHVIQLEKCLVAITEIMAAAAADAAPSISSVKSPLAASELPRAMLDRRDSSSASASASAAASPLSVAASSTSSPLSTPSLSHIAGHIMAMLASSLSATENSRRRELFDKALGNVTRHTSHVTRHTSHVTRHTSHVTRHTSHVTRHTSHVIRHTSHVTRHTSHVAASSLTPYCSNIRKHISFNTLRSCRRYRVVRRCRCRHGRRYAQTRLVLESFSHLRG
jgi:hypothetical protein